MLLWISLLILWHYSQHGDGFRLFLSSNHFIWTYSPTAVFVIIVSLWRQVDYHVKVSQPWKVLLKTSSPAKTTILLDYLWPLQINSFVAAIRNRHLVVVASILVFTILKLVTLISTGLLVSRSLHTPTPTQIELQTKFSGADFWSTIPRAGAGYNVSNATGYAPAYKNMSSAFISNFLSSLDDPTFRRSDILGVSAIQNFSMSLDAPFSKVMVNESTVTPYVTCEPAKFIQEQFKPGAHADFSIVSDTCPTYQPGQVQLSNLRQKVSITDTNISYYPSSPNLTTSYAAWRVNCLLNDDHAAEDSMILDNSVPYDMRIVIAQLNYTNTTADFIYSENYFNQTVTLNRSSQPLFVMQEAQGVLCKVDYNLQDTLISKSHDTYSNLTSLEVSNVTRHFQDLSNIQLTEVLWSAMNNASGRIDLLVDTPYYEGLFPIQITKHYIDKIYGNGPVFDEQAMLQGFGGALAGLIARFMVESYSAPTSTKINATGVLDEERLYVDDIVLGGMVAALIITMLLSLAMAIDTPCLISFLEQGQIAGIATVLASSEGLQYLLQPLSYLEMKTFEQNLTYRSFTSTRNSHSLCIAETQPDLAQKRPDSVKKIAILFKKTGNWVKRIVGDWSKKIVRLFQKQDDSIKKEADSVQSRTPLMARWYMLTLTLTLPLSAIIILEVLSQLSDKHNGVLYVKDVSSTNAYLIRYTSTFIVLCITTLFNSFDFTIGTFAPFYLLSTKARPTAICTQSSPLSLMPPVALLQALKNRRLGPAASMLACLVGSVLTVIVSGLWVVRDGTASYPVYINRTSLWDLNWTASDSDNAGLERLRLLQQDGKLPLAETWGDLVLPDLRDLQVPGAFKDTVYQGNYTFDLPALRLRLECLPLTNDRINVSYAIQDSNLNGYMSVNFTLPVPNECPSDLDDSFHWNQTITWQDVNYYGDFASSIPWLYANMFNMPNYGLQCPTVGAVMVYGSERRTTTREELLPNTTVIYCFQGVQQVPLTTTFVGDPALVQLDPSLPPFPIEAEAKYPYNESSMYTNFSYAFVNLPYSTIAPDTPSSPNTSTGIGTAAAGMFNILFPGRPAAALTGLASPANHSLFARTLEDFYSKVMVQIADAEFRQPVNSLTDNREQTRLTGTMHVVRSRLVINNTSKLILQIMLASMFVLGIISCMFTTLRGILPREPTSIASAMALLAGSELCSRTFMPEGAEFMSKKELEKVFTGRNEISLGWWHTSTDMGLDIDVPESSNSGRASPSPTDRNRDQEGHNPPIIEAEQGEQITSMEPREAETGSSNTEGSSGKPQSRKHRHMRFGLDLVKLS